ncbi:MAG: FtsX-like permease family protein [Hyphomicrobiales bacterium]|nr:FtsX-like permease family protein [Hyphomicrobiales bacterium]
MNALDKKLLRDVMHIWTQVLAVALVMAAGVATIIIAIGAHRSLEETRAAYYERYRFADVFSGATRAPSSIVERVGQIPGVAVAEGRIVKPLLLDVEGMPEPASGLAISLPEGRPPHLNDFFMRAGRLPKADAGFEAVIGERFAKAHKFVPGSRFEAVINGRKRVLSVTGIALSPEYIYALGPGDVMPDDRRFAILWMAEETLEAAFDLDGAVNSISVKLMKGASEQAVIKQLDQLLARYGGLGAYGRKDQLSHAFLDSELEELRGMRNVLPPIFMVVTAFLINMIMTRLIALEREQIGLLKAVGYSRAAIAWHYVKLVLIISSIGIVIGYGMGQWLGRGLTRLYAKFFSYPFLIFDNSADVFILAAATTMVAGLLGASSAVWHAAALPPAVAMRPPAPTAYRTLMIGRFNPFAAFDQMTRMTIRHMTRRPVRAAGTLLGIALSLSVLISSLFVFDAIEFMIDMLYFRADRQHATLMFSDEKHMRTIQEAARLPGVIKTEPARAISARIRHGHLSRRVAVVGKPAGAELSRVLDLEMRPVIVPRSGIVLSDKLAGLLNVTTGNYVTVELLEGHRRVFDVVVAGKVRSYIGLLAAMDMDSLNELAGEGEVISAVHMAVDTSRTEALYGKVKELPAVASITLQRVSLARFRDTLAKNITTMMLVYTSLGVIIAFGVAYNSARIQLSERARELASLRVLGFTRAEVSRILLNELAILTVLALPIGWAGGYGLAWLTAKGLDTEVHRIPFVIDRDTFAWASVVLIVAVALSALIVRLRINKLDLIAVLKTRD